MAIHKKNMAGVPISYLCREHGMSSANFYKWSAKYGGMDASLIKGLKYDDRRLKKIYIKDKPIVEVAKDFIEMKL